MVARLNSFPQPFLRLEGGQPVSEIKAYLKTPALRGSFPRMNTKGLAILNLRLAGIDKRGDPYNVVANHLESYFPPPGKVLDGGLSTFELEFDINPTKVKDLQNHQAALGAVIKQWCR